MSDTDYEPTDEDVRIIRDWLEKMPYIVQDYDEDFLKRFISGCKGRLEKTKKVLENFNALNFKYPDSYGHFDIFDEKIQNYLSVGRVILLPQRLQDGSAVILISLDIYDDNHDPYKVSWHELLRYLHMIFYVTVWERRNKEKLVLILDWRKMIPSDFREVTPMYLKSVTAVLETSMPLRLQAVHNIFVPPFLEYILNLAKSLVKKKASDRILFHSKMESLFESIPKKMLPKDYGGDEPDMKTLHEQGKKKVESYRDRLVEEHSKMKKLDAIRPKTMDIRNFVGTFKTLNVD